MITNVNLKVICGFVAFCCVRSQNKNLYFSFVFFIRWKQLEISSLFSTVGEGVRNMPPSRCWIWHHGTGHLWIRRVFLLIIVSSNSAPGLTRIECTSLGDLFSAGPSSITTWGMILYAMMYPTTDGSGLLSQEFFWKWLISMTPWWLHFNSRRKYHRFNQ